MKLGCYGGGMSYSTSRHDYRDLGAPIVQQRQRWAEYRICKERGHQPSEIVTASLPPQNICRHCGTHYWTETIKREINAPVDPDAPVSAS